MGSRRSWGAARALLVCCLVAALTLPAAGVAGAQADDVPPGGVPGVPVPVLTWEPCGENAELATAEIPVDYFDASLGTLELAVARRPADDRENRIGSLFVNFGGPGGPAIGAVCSVGDLLFPAEVLERFDIVGVDPRGIGASTPVTCWDSFEEIDEFYAGQPPFPVTRLEETLVILKNRQLAARCEARNGDLLDHVSTTAFARDLDVLRAAVGDEQFTYVGYSYGTDLGAVYANLFPGRVRALVLDAVLDPVDFNTGPPRTISSARIESDEGAYATLLEFFRTCREAAGEACAFSSSEGDPQAKYEELADALLEEPLLLEAPEGPVEVTYALLVQFTLGSLYSPYVWPDFAALLQELYDALPAGAGPGDAYARFRRHIEEARSRFQPPQEEGEGVQGPEGFLAVTCAETDNPRFPYRWGTVGRQRDRVAPYFGRAWTWVTGPCAQWPGRATDRYTGPWTAATANPVLIVGERFDPATNYASAIKLEGLLPNSTLLTLDGYGHTAQNSTCIDEAVTTYLLTVTTPPPATVCQQDSGPFDPLIAADSGRALVEESVAVNAAMPTVTLPGGD